MKNREQKEAFITTFLQETLSEIPITCAIEYGSSVNEEIYTEGISDMDIIAFVDEMNEAKAEEMIRIITFSRADYMDKQPIYFNDGIAKRVEFYLKHDGDIYDVTLLSKNFPMYETRYETACYDSFEILAGALCKYNKVLFGEMPYKTWGKENFLPYYAEDLRHVRMKILNNRLQGYMRRLEQNYRTKQEELMDMTYKARNYFLKYLFIYYKEYPVSLCKHLRWQFQTLLHLPKEEMEALLFEKGTLDEQVGALLQVMNKYLVEV